MVTTTHPKRRRVIPAVVAVVAVVFSLLVASPAQAATEPIVLTGQVQIERVGPAAAGQFEVTARLSGQSAIVGTALTGADGRFSVTGLTTRGVYFITATPVDEPGLFPVSRSINTFETDLTRDVGTLVSLNRRTFSGVVVTPEGGNIPDGTTSVTVRNAVTGWSATSPVVDGRFSFSGLDPVSHQIEIDYTGSSGFYDLPATTVSGLPTGDVTNRIYKLSRGASVIFKLSGEASQPAPSDTVVTLYKWAESGWAQVDFSEIAVPSGSLGSDGEMMYLNLGPGDYLAHVAPPNPSQPSFWIQPSGVSPWPSYQYSNRDLSVRGTPSFQIASAYASTLTVTRAVRSLRTLSGTVLLPGGAPAADGVVRVTLSGPSDQGTRDLATELLDDGTFSFSGLVPWTYQLRVDYLPDASSIDTTVNFALSAAPQASPATITLVHSYTISGTLSLGESSRTVPAGTRVEISRSLCCENWTVTTDANGEFSLAGLSAGVYIVGIPDFGDATWDRADTRVVLSENVDPDLDIVLLKYPTIEGKVTTRTGTALPRILVVANLYDPTTGDYVSQLTTTTDAAGRYSFRTTGPFDVEVYFLDPAGVYATAGWDDVNPYYVPDLVTLSPGTQATGIDARLYKEGRLTGKITTPGIPASDRYEITVEVMVYDDFAQRWVGTEDYYEVTSAGNFTIRDIYPDEYRLRVYYSGRGGDLTAYSPVVAVASGTTRSVGTIRFGMARPTVVGPPSVDGETEIWSTWYVESGFSGVPAPTKKYQWLRCSHPVAAGLTKVPAGCTVIAGATRDEYRTKTSDAGYYLTAIVTATNPAGSIRVIAETSERMESLVAPTNTEAPSVTGSSTIGSTWTSFSGTFAGTTTPTLTRAWYRCANPVTTVTAGVPAGCVAISGATKWSYTSTPADAGKYLIAIVTATNTVGKIRIAPVSTVRVDSLAAPTSTVAPNVTGSTTIGATWTLDPGTFTGAPAPTIKRAWYRCTNPVAAVTSGTPAGCAAISGATGLTYTSTTADAGKYLIAIVTATNVVSSIRLASASTVRTESLVKPAYTEAPSVTGSAAIGSTWAVDPGTFTGTPAPTLKRTWYRCTKPVATVATAVPSGCVAISGATGTTYKSTKSDAGKYLVVIVTATNAAGSIRVSSLSTVRTG